MTTNLLWFAEFKPNALEKLIDDGIFEELTSQNTLEDHIRFTGWSTLNLDNSELFNQELEGTRALIDNYWVLTLNMPQALLKPQSTQGADIYSYARELTQRLHRFLVEHTDVLLLSSTEVDPDSYASNRAEIERTSQLYVDQLFKE
jgi:hypothetical protein